jgi:hypothetical protein
MNSCHDVAYKKKEGDLCCVSLFVVFYDACGQGSHLRGFSITPRHTTLGVTPLDEWSARHTDHYLTTHNTHKRQTSMPQAGFKPTVPANEWPQTHSLDRAATTIGFLFHCAILHLSNRYVDLAFLTKIGWRHKVEKEGRKEGRKEKYMERGN